MAVLVRRTIMSVRTPIIFPMRNNTSDTTKRIQEVVEDEGKTLSGFGKAFVKLSKLVNQPSLVDEPDLKFTALLRHSKLMQVTCRNTQIC